MKIGHVVASTLRPSGTGSPPLGNSPKRALTSPFLLWSSLGLLVLGLSAAALPVAAQSAPSAGVDVQVGPSVQVSAALASDPHGEVEIGANPSDANELAACSMVFPNDSPTNDVVTYVTFDGGKTWKLSLRAKGDDGHASWDPDCQYGPGRILYSLSEGRSSNYPEDDYDRIDRSTDGGNTWGSPTFVAHAERSFLLVDKRPGPRHGWLYLYGMGPDEDSISVGYSSDGGKSFFTQVVRAKQGMRVANIGSGVILADGTLVFPRPIFQKPAPGTPQTFRVELPGSIQVVRAKFQQPNWPLKVETSTVAPWFADFEPNGSYYAYLAVDSSHGPFRGRIYAVWEDRFSGRSQVKLAFSSDEGKTWTQPRVLDDDVARQVGDTIHGPDDIHGNVAVNKFGVVGVMWLDRRDYADNLGWSVRFRASLDGGETFLPSSKASNADYEPGRDGPVPLFGDGDWEFKTQSTNSLTIPWFAFHGGHTMGLAADADGGFHPLWIANPAGTPQVWTTDITVKGHAVKNGSPGLAELKNANKRVRLEFLDRYYNVKTHVLDFDLRLENVSNALLRGPLKVRVLNVGSYIGQVTVNSGGAEKSVEGTVWDFTPFLHDGVFRPGEITKPIHVHLTVRGIDPFSQMGHFALFETPVAVLTTKVLAGSIDLPKVTKAQEPK